MSGSNEVMGIIQKSIHSIFQRIDSTPDREFLIRVSFMEIYQETICDLISGKKISSVREDPPGNICIPDLEEVCVTNNDKVNSLYFLV